MKQGGKGMDALIKKVGAWARASFTRRAREQRDGDERGMVAGGSHSASCLANLLGWCLMEAGEEGAWWPPGPGGYLVLGRRWPANSASLLLSERNNNPASPELFAYCSLCSLSLHSTCLSVSTCQQRDISNKLVPLNPLSNMLQLADDDLSDGCSHGMHSYSWGKSSTV